MKRITKLAVCAALMAMVLSGCAGNIRTLERIQPTVRYEIPTEPYASEASLEMERREKLEKREKIRSLLREIRKE